jgi:hypothetical protein
MTQLGNARLACYGVKLESGCPSGSWVFVIFIAIVFTAINEPLLTEHRVLWLAIISVAYFSAVIPPVANMTRYRPKHVLYVVLWGLISLAFFLTIFYLFFFALAQSEAQQRQWERVLNLPPILAAAIAAAIGWYAVHQFSSKKQ